MIDEPNDGASDVLIWQQSRVGRITLNRAQAMNALTLDMVRKIHTVLQTWSVDPQIAFILLDGAGERGLCAGGDIRALYASAKAGDFASAATFLREEYRLNNQIATYPKPYVALMDGVVMGGGIGLSAHGRHRIVTERSLLAMPEVGIGFIPDVGGTHLLASAPGELGTYLALTGGRINAADAILCGLADAFVPGDQLPALSNELAVCDDQAGIETVLKSFSKSSPEGKLHTSRTWIDESFARSSVDEIVQSLQSSSNEDALKATAEILRNSPTSLKLALLALRNARHFGELVSCLQQEYLLGLACLREGDFIEGVRAAVVDKDRKPVWNPATLAEITPDRLASFSREPDPALALPTGWFS